MSHWIRVTRENGTQSSSATSCVWAVYKPCPSSHLPVSAVTLPSAFTRIQRSSCSAAGAIEPLRGGVSGRYVQIRRQSHRAKRDDQRTAGVKELAAIHALPPFAYRLIALIIRLWAAQRHKTFDNAWRISGSDARGLRSSSAFAVMMTPLRQKPH